MLSLWTALLLPLLPLPALKATRLFDGTYTMVNKANGHRMLASTSSGLWIVDDSGPINSDQMWLFVPQPNDSYAIVNGADSLRVLAQGPGSSAGNPNGLFAMDGGLNYQDLQMIPAGSEDQRWHLHPQVDGSYSIVNVKSARRIFARIDVHGNQRFAAVADSGPVQPDETWWIINQERDETARLMEELEVEKDRVASLANDAAVTKSQLGQLAQRLQSAVASQRQLADQAEASKHESLSVKTRLQDELLLKARLTDKVSAHQVALARVQSELLAAKRHNDNLLAEAWAHQREQLAQNSELETSRTIQNSDLEASKAIQHKLTQALKARGSETTRLASELQAMSEAKEQMAEALSRMHGQVAKLSAELDAADASKLEMASKVAKLSAELDAADASKLQLASKVKQFEALPGLWTFQVEMDVSMRVAVTLLSMAVVAATMYCGRQFFGLMAEVRSKSKHISLLEQEIKAEFGNMVCVGDSDGGLGSDFGFCVFNTENNQEAVRLIKVQCPGVKHADVEIELIFNGCEVTIRRQASQGVSGAVWKRRFQFKPSDGLFEFREEMMALEDGFLKLVFRAGAFQSRMVLFPRHFCLSESDTDACWDYAVNGDEDQGDGVEAFWHDDMPGPQHFLLQCGKPADVDTESTASTARVLV